MTILPFPRGAAARDRAAAQQSWLTDLDAALDGVLGGAEAADWRELRADVRMLPPPIDSDFERQLAARFSTNAATPSARPRPRPRPRRWLGVPLRGALGAGAGGAAVAAAIAVLIAAPWHSQAPDVTNGSSSTSPSSAATSSSAGAEASAKGAPAKGARTAAGPATGLSGNVPRQGGTAKVPSRPSAGANQAAIRPNSPAGSSMSEGAATASPRALPSVRYPPAGSRRVQQVSASLALSTSPSEVQAVSDRVARVTVQDGGFVRSSHVEAQGRSEGEARMSLSLPSSNLEEALASIERLAAVRSKSQSLLDITSSYDTAKARLSDAKAERAALLRALSQAITQGQIESLHARLGDARGEIERASAQLQRVSHRGSTALVEVEISGHASRPGAGSGSTLGTGLRDAGHVLTVALVVLLIGAAALVPLALLIALATLTHRLWRRHRRERALDAA